MDHYNHVPSKNDSNEENFKYSKSEEIISDLSSINGFSPRKTSKTEKEAT
ncbi:hypothetical protein QRY03_12160 [Enterococcus hirae]|nr:hypothetical protein [Enterococcus hirae]MDL4918643.1 hypothetical protein [Enterococcus hirae]MDL4927822.1 hypothetical protein [Enterococcus hirae]